jgi:leukotriene-A4 hydrolase
MSHKFALGDDIHSWSNWKQVVVVHADIKVTIDFTRKLFFGYVDNTISILHEGTNSLVLDTRALAIEDVGIMENGEFKPLLFTLPKNHPALGLALHIPLPEGLKGDKNVIRIYYSTTPKSSAIQWFEPHQTTGKKQPYCYTQCQAILARTLVPCMDTPSVKFTYSIQITCPDPLIAVASGTAESSNPHKENNGWLTYAYKQNLPIPAYLIAVACGALKTKKIGPRSAVWTEEELLEAAVHEFSSHTENFIKAAEGIFKDIPYLWGTYDILILPTAFPYGGMENPQLTFVNASIIAGDQSLVDVVAHEICHSWSGNLVTNNSWQDFWINEGFTMYLERALLSAVIGGEDYRKFHLFLGYSELKRVVKDMLDAGEVEFTKLKPNLLGTDPDDAFSIIPYEKGCLLLYFLETIVGGKDAFLTWLNDFYAANLKKTISSDDMKNNFLKYFSGKVDASKLSSIDWDTWFNAPGLPSFDPSSSLVNSYSKAAEAILHKWIHTKDGSDLSPADIANFKPSQVMFCLDELVISSRMPVDHAVLAKMEENYHMLYTRNIEIANRFIAICLKSKYTPALPACLKVLAEHGRGRYVKYLYNVLNDYDHNEAVKAFQANKHKYHTVIVNAFATKLAK